jgi:hypothetical protein
VEDVLIREVEAVGPPPAIPRELNRFQVRKATDRLGVSRYGDRERSTDSLERPSTRGGIECFPEAEEHANPDL